MNNAIESHLNATSHENCQTFIADVKVAISLEGPFLYPDFILTCDDRDRDVIQFIAHPKLIGEVLSPSTETYDRGAKFRQYRKLDTLQGNCSTWVKEGSITRDGSLNRLKG